ncbi:MAG: UDP-N-acetylmuramate--L-alanine ligase [Candidatus Paceibacterota bacterium]
MEKKHYYFIGIGGIGMSALARMMLNEGHTVSGSDRAQSKLTETLETEGVSVVYEQNAQNITDEIDQVVYTMAIPQDHPELAAAREGGLVTLSYPEMLGEISKDKYTIAIAGTHGKTTTTAMVARILIEAGYDPTVIVGSLLRKGSVDTSTDTAEKEQWGSNFIPGKSDYLVVEACEYKRSFLHLNPNVLIITNIEEDHLDYYKNLADIQSAFDKLAEKVPSDGAIICNPQSTNVMPVVGRYREHVVDYTQTPLDGVTLRVPGEHNKANAQAALSAAATLGVKGSAAQDALSGFEGTWRRYEYKGEQKVGKATGALFYDDYAHHPSEIKTTLAAFREQYPDRNLRIIFQPHLYSRTSQLLDAFAESFEQADEVIVAPIYAAREDPAEGVDNHALTEAIVKHGTPANVRALDSFEAIAEYISDSLEPSDLVVTFGAGDISAIHSHFV